MLGRHMSSLLNNDLLREEKGRLGGEMVRRLFNNDKMLADVVKHIEYVRRKD